MVVRVGSRESKQVVFLNLFFFYLNFLICSLLPTPPPLRKIILNFAFYLIYHLLFICLFYTFTEVNILTKKSRSKKSLSWQKIKRSNNSSLNFLIWPSSFVRKKRGDARGAVGRVLHAQVGKRVPASRAELQSEMRERNKALIGNVAIKSLIPYRIVSWYRFQMYYLPYPNL